MWTAFSEARSRRTSRLSSPSNSNRVTSSRLDAPAVLAQELYERQQWQRHLSSAWIIQKECGRANLPVLEQGNQTAGLDLSRGIAETRIQHAHAIQRGADGQLGIVDR